MKEYLQRFIHLLRVFVLFGIAFGKIVQLNSMFIDVAQQLLLQGRQFALQQCIGLGNDRNDIHLVLKMMEEIAIDWSKPRNDSVWIRQTSTDR